MPAWPRPLLMSTVFCAAALLGVRVCADEIRLKDGKKLYGVIVSYEDNMFKVKTDFGYVLVEKDKIASIIPSVPGDAKKAKTEAPESEKPAPAKPAVAAGKPVTTLPSKKEEHSSANAPATVTAAPATATASAPAPAIAKSQAPVAGTKGTAPDVAPAASKPTPAKAASSEVTNPAPPPTEAGKIPTKAAIPVVNAIPPAKPPKPKPAEPPVNRESLEGNVYINYTHGFRMYKAPSWRLIDDARKTIPNAIVAMGTLNESTIMVVGEEKTKDTLEVAAADVESRLRDTYGNYRHISQQKTVAGGFPAIEIRYRGLADDHDWSGTLLIVARSGDIFSIVGMTHSDTDLIQIQENVIARAIASLEFNSN